MTLKRILQQHPAPWRYQTHKGQVFVFDAAGQQVQLFTMLDYIVLTSRGLVARAAEPAPASAPYNESVTTELPKEA